MSLLQKVRLFSDFIPVIVIKLIICDANTDVSKIDLNPENLAKSESAFL